MTWYTTPYYQIKINGSLISNSLSNFPLPIKISSLSGATGYDMTTFFTDSTKGLTSLLMSDNFEQYVPSTYIRDGGTGWVEYLTTQNHYVAYNSTTPNSGTQCVQAQSYTGGGFANAYRYIGGVTGPNITSGIISGAMRADSQSSNLILKVGVSSLLTTLGSEAGSIHLRYNAAATPNTISAYLYYYSSGTDGGHIATPLITNVIMGRWYTFTLGWQLPASVYQVYGTITDTSTGVTYYSYPSPPTIAWTATNLGSGTAQKSVFLSNSSAGNPQTTGYFDDIAVTTLTDYSRKFSITNYLGTELPIERIAFDSVNNQCYLFVKVDTINAISDTMLYLWFDKGHADNSLVGLTTEDATHNVWPSEYSTVYHLEDNLSLSGLQVKDSTVYQNDAQKNGALTASNTVSAYFHNGISFEGTSSFLSTANSNSLNITGNLSVCASILCNTISGTKNILNKWNVSSSNCSWKFDVVGKKLKVSLGNPTTGTADYYTVTTDDDVLLSTSQYFVVGFTFNAGATAPITIYVNSMPKSSTTITGTDINGVATTVQTNIVVPATLYPATGATLGVGCSSNGGGADFYSGIVDEIRIISGLKDSGWFEAIYHGLNDDLVRWNIVQNQMLTGYVYINPSSVNSTNNIPGSTFWSNVVGNPWYPSGIVNFATTGEIATPTVIPTLTASTGEESVTTIVPTLTASTGEELVSTVIPTVDAQVGYVTNGLAIGYITFNIAGNMAGFANLSASLPALSMSETRTGAVLAETSLPALIMGDGDGYALRNETAYLFDGHLPALSVVECIPGINLAAGTSLPALTLLATGNPNNPSYLLATLLPPLSLSAHAFANQTAYLNASLPALISTAATSDDVNAHLSDTLPSLLLAGHAVVMGINYLSASLPALTLDGFTYNNPRANLNASLPALAMEEECAYAYATQRFDDYTLQYTR